PYTTLFRSGRSDETVARLLGVASLQSINGGIRVEQGVAVSLLDAVVLELAFRVDRVEVGAVADDRARQDGEITGRRLVRRVGQARGVHKMRVRHPEALGFGVHQVGKALF